MQLQGLIPDTLDLQDAYFYIAIHPSHRKYLQLTTVFEVMVVACLWQEAVLIVLYLDHRLFKGQPFMAIFQPDSSYSVPGAEPSAERKEIHAGTGTKNTIYWGVLGLTDSQSISPVRQICDLVRSGRDKSGKPLEHNNELSSILEPYGSLHLCDQSHKAFATAASRVS